MLGFKLPIVAGENIGVRVLWVEGDRVDQNLLSGERYSRGELEVHLALQTPPHVLNRPIAESRDRVY